MFSFRTRSSRLGSRAAIVIALVLAVLGSLALFSAPAAARMKNTPTLPQGQGGAPVDDTGAGCSFDDIVNAVVNVFEGVYTYLQNPECAAHVGDLAFWIVTSAVSFARTTSPGLVGQACDELTAAGNDVQDFKNKANQWLPQLGVSVADVKTVVDAAGDIANVLNFVGCACSLSQVAGPLTQVASDCIEDALCSLDEFVFGNSCDNAVKPIELVDCTKISTPIYGGSCDAKGFCISSAVSAGYSGMACFCPPPMKVRWDLFGLCRIALPGPGENQWDPKLFANTQFECGHCLCPEGSNPKGDTAILSRICVCDDGQLVGADGQCPPKTGCGCSCPDTQIVTNIWKQPDGRCDCSCGCKQGQELIDEKCVTTCSDPTKVLLANGSCCAPSQVAACGTCCPAGMKPDAASGSCVSHLVAVPRSQPPQHERNAVPKKRP